MTDDRPDHPRSGDASTQEGASTRHQNRRVVVIGNTASGKTTVGRELAERLGVPFTDSDDLFWLPGWVEVDNDTFRQRLDEASSGDGWVIVGNYLSRATDITWPRATDIVWLDMPLPLVLYRSVTRTAKRGISKELVCNGNTERLLFLLPERFSGEKPLWQYAREHHEHHRPIIEAMLAEPKVTARVHRLRSRAEVRRFLAAFEGA